MKDELSSYRLSMDDLSMLLRNHNVFSITEVEYAILEPNGTLSIVKKAAHQPITRTDMNLESSSTAYIPSKIIVNGKLLEDNLEELDLDKEWVEEQLREQDINSIKDVFYAEIQKDGSLFVDTN